MYIYKICLPDNIKTSIDSEITVQDMIIREIEHISPFIRRNRLIIDDSKYKRKYGFNLSGGEIANFLTHREAWKEFFESGLPWCLIVESNVHLNLAVDQIEQTIRESPEDWDVFFPYDLQAQSLRRRREINGLNLINANYWEVETSQPYVLGYKQGNSIYMLSNAGAKKMLSIKTIKDRLDHTMLNMLYSDALNVHNSYVDWFDINFIKDYNWPDRCRLIYDMALKQSSWNEKRLEKARDLLKTLSDISFENSIPLMLESGSLLGYIRHGSIMMWDDDIDLGIEEKDIEAFFTQIEKNPNLHYGGEFRYGATRYFKIWDIGGEKIEGYPYTFPFVDVWVYNYIEDDLVYETGITYRNTTRLGLEDVIFEGARYKIPRNSIEALDSCFTDWKNMIRVYTWCHKSERHGFKDLYIPIKTDDKGRMVSFG